MTQMFPDPRRIVTGHNDEGKAVVVADGTIPCVPTGTKTNFAVLYETHRFPDNLDEWNDPVNTRTTDLSNSNGIVLRIVDIPAHTETMFHRTESLDFGILFKGEITCYLDDGVRIDMKEGDTCVQRGTIHGWTNHSDKPARIYFILTAAHPVKSNGKLLTATGYSKKEVESGGRSN
ncbi:Cupin domain-containing protein [Cladophialophora immunda]|nr:Cupin domain-containing protein [Cladophialophora immunda]